MTTIQKILLLFIVLFLAAIPAWLYFAVPELLKQPKNFIIKYDLISSESTQYGIGEEWTEKTLLKGNVDIFTTKATNDKLYLDGTFHIEYLDGSLSYETNEQHIVDRKLKQTDDGRFFLFPPDLREQEYAIRFPGWNFPLNVKYTSSENIDGLDVYRFISVVREVNLTDSFEFLDLVPEQYSVSVDADGSFWVEPTSGILVNFDESGINYYVEGQEKRRIQPFSAFSNKFSDDTIANQVRLAQNEKQRILLYERWIPILLLILALSFLTALFASRRINLNRKDS